MATSSTANEVLVDIGQRLQARRLSRAMRQADLAAKAGVSRTAVQALEAGKGSTLETLIRVLRALDLERALDALAPAATVSPMALLEHAGRAPQRARRKRPKP